VASRILEEASPSDLRWRRGPAASRALDSRSLTPASPASGADDFVSGPPPSRGDSALPPLPHAAARPANGTRRLQGYRGSGSSTRSWSRRAAPLATRTAVQCIARTSPQRSSRRDRLENAAWPARGGVAVGVAGPQCMIGHLSGIVVIHERLGRVEGAGRRGESRRATPACAGTSSPWGASRPHVEPDRRHRVGRCAPSYRFVPHLDHGAARRPLGAVRRRSQWGCWSRGLGCSGIETEQ